MSDWMETEPESCDTMQLAISNALREFVQRGKKRGREALQEKAGL